MSLKVLLISYKFDPDIGGIETSSKFLADTFKKENYEVRVLTTTPGAENKNFGYDVIRNPSAIASIRHHLWADIVIENNPCLRLGFPKLMLKKKSVVVLQTWLNISAPKLSWSDQIRLYYLGRSTRLIAISKAIQERCWPSALLIGNAYNDDTFRVLPHKRNESFVFVGRLVSDKGAELAVRAFSHIVFSEKIPELAESTLTIIGDGIERQKLSDLITELPDPNRVRLVGPLTGQTLADELNRHTFQFIPSLWEEPFGIVALEGISCGLIPIASDGGGLPDAVGKAGVLFRRGQLASLIAVTKNLAQSAQVRKQCLAAAPEHLQHFSRQTIARNYLDVINSCLSIA